ncbi:MAG: hypothetical protein U0175_26955 [Caldilineaceae bacterium]
MRRTRGDGSTARGVQPFAMLKGKRTGRHWVHHVGFTGLVQRTGLR